MHPHVVIAYSLRIFATAYVVPFGAKSRKATVRASVTCLGPLPRLGIITGAMFRAVGAALACSRNTIAIGAVSSAMSVILFARGAGFIGTRAARNAGHIAEWNNQCK